MWSVIKEKSANNAYLCGYWFCLVLALIKLLKNALFQQLGNNSASSVFASGISWMYTAMLIRKNLALKEAKLLLVTASLICQLFSVSFFLIQK